MKKLTAYIGLLLLFTTGIGVGVAGHSAWMKERFRRFEKRGPRFQHGENMKRMTERLELSPEQRDQIAAIIQASHENSETFRKEYYAENNVRKRETTKTIQQVLTEEQRASFKEILKLKSEEMKKQRDAGSQKNPDRKRPLKQSPRPQ